jgi:hypothetical protein
MSNTVKNNLRRGSGHSIIPRHFPLARESSRQTSNHVLVDLERVLLSYALLALLLSTVMTILCTRWFANVMTVLSMLVTLSMLSLVTRLRRAV